MCDFRCGKLKDCNCGEDCFMLAQNMIKGKGERGKEYYAESMGKSRRGGPAMVIAP
jgi:hypothetical protein